MSDRIPDGWMESTAHFAAPGQAGDVVVTHGWTIPDEPDPAIWVPDIASNFSAIMGNLSASITMTKVSFVVGVTGGDLTYEAAVSFPGEAMGNMTPINNCFLVQKRTASGGRRGRGRTFLPGVAEGAVNDDGTLAPGIADGLNSNLADFVETMFGNGCIHTLLHETAPHTPSAVTSYLAQPLIATQRKRLR